MRNPRLSQFLFCYGTLMFPELLAAVCRRRFPCEEAVLRGYARYRLRGAAFPGVAAAERREVHGMLYRGIGPRCLRRLDRYEDDCYERRLLRVRDGAGRARMAWVYIVPDQRRECLSDAPWDMGEFRRRHLRDWLYRLSG